MSLCNITCGNVAYFISKYKNDLHESENNLKKIVSDVYDTEKDWQQERSLADHKYNKLTNKISDEIFEFDILNSFLIHFEENKYLIDLKRYDGFLKKIDDLLMNSKISFEDINSFIKPILLECDEVKIKQKPARYSQSILNSRQTKHPFIFTILEPLKKVQCNGCRNYITNTNFLKHLEEYPSGSHTLKQHFYHATKSCFDARGFEDKFLHRAKVFSEETLDNNQVQDLLGIGFRSENIHMKDDSDCESETSDKLNDLSPVSSIPIITTVEFIYRRNDSGPKKNVSCISCKKIIDSDTFLTLGGVLENSVHISKNCVQSANKVALDFSSIKCMVFGMLRTNNELRQLLSCGFYYNKIIGFKPKRETMKQGFKTEKDLKPKKSKKINYFYRRKEKTSKTKITCVGCSKEIFQDSFITHGDSLSQPLHIHKNCITSLNGGVLEDFKVVKCHVERLLQNHRELKQLIACGFYFNNIIGFRPNNFDVKDKPTEDNMLPKNSSTKDNGFIFNKEPFIYERIPERKYCVGCSGLIKDREMALRHDEIVPRNISNVEQLESQYYHPQRSCLMERGFTEKYLEFVSSYVVSTGDDDRLKMEDCLVRCGFSSANINSNRSASSEGTSKRYLFVGNCTKSTGHCAGCGFKLLLDDSCFIYGERPLQDGVSRLFHVKGTCLKNHFTDVEMNGLTCVNGNSITGLSREQIEACGIRHIRSAVPSPPSAFTPKGKADPLRLEQRRFQVDLAADGRQVCLSCGSLILADRYFLRSLGDGADRAIMHLEASCLRSRGYLPAHLARSTLKLAVAISEDCRQRLHACGFRDIPLGL